MFAFAVLLLDSVFQYLAKSRTRNTISEMTYFVLGGM